MRIAVDTRDWLNGKTPYAHFISELIRRITVKHTEHQFIFFTDSPSANTTAFAANVTLVRITPVVRNGLQLKWWYDVRLPLALKKHKADLLLCPNCICSTSTSLPQVMIVEDVPNRSRVSYRNSLRSRKRYKASLEQASAICVLLQAHKDQLVEFQQVSAEKIHLIHGAVDESFHPLTQEEKEQVKDKYTEGNEFLITSADEEREYLLALKAYSIFKKWQRTGMKLILAAEVVPTELHDKLTTYKYRDDVILLEHLPQNELAALTGAAYAFIYPSSSNKFPYPVLQSLKTSTPIIALETESVTELAVNAATYSIEASSEAIAEKMKLLFKDETMRNTLIKESEQLNLHNSFTSTIQSLWSILNP